MLTFPRRLARIAILGSFAGAVACAADTGSVPDGAQPEFCDNPQTCIEFCLCTTNDAERCLNVCEPGGGGAPGGGGTTGGGGSSGGSAGGTTGGGAVGATGGASNGGSAATGGTTTGGTSGGGTSGSSNGGGTAQGPSCAGKCGSTQPVDGQCYCDSQCAQYGDCCADFTSACGGGGGTAGGGGTSGGGGTAGTAGTAGGGGTTGSCGDDGSGWSSSFQNFECQVIALVNQERAKGASCGGVSYPPAGPLVRHQLLTNSARAHAKDMGDKGYFSHTGLDGSSPFQRMKAAGYSGSTMGENIAAGQGTPASVVSGWMKSSGHCKNIMNGKYKDLGVGYYLGSSSYKHYWVQNFGG
ncbi:MAG: CAP domain-containing protein [Polyangiaceae bacterium]